MQAVLERGHDPEVAAAAAQAPEQVGVLVLARAQQVAVDGHDVGGQQVVDRGAVAAHQPADPAAEREAGDARVGDDAADRGQAVFLRGGVEVAPQDTGSGASGPRFGVQLDRAHRRQVDHEAVVVDAQARDAVAAAADGDREVALAGEPERGGHVGGARGAGDQRGPAVDRAVPDLAGLVVVVVAGAQQLTLEGRGRHAGTVPRGAAAGQVHDLYFRGPCAVGDWARGGPHLRPVLPGRAGDGDPRDALDADHRAQPPARVRDVRRADGRRARHLAHAAQQPARAARAVRGGRAGAERSRLALPADRVGPRPRRRGPRDGHLGRALAGDDAGALRLAHRAVVAVSSDRREGPAQPAARDPLRASATATSGGSGSSSALPTPRSASSRRATTRTWS